MDPTNIDGITDIAQQAIEGVTNSQNNWAAIILLIALLGVLGIVAFYVRGEAKERSKRYLTRENQTRVDNTRRENEIRQGYQDQLQQARITQEFIGRMNDRYDATLNRVTEAFGVNSAVVRAAQEEMRRSAEVIGENSEIIELNTQALKQIAASRLPKSSTPRKDTNLG